MGPALQRVRDSALAKDVYQIVSNDCIRCTYIAFTNDPACCEATIALYQ